MKQHERAKPNTPKMMNDITNIFELEVYGVNVNVVNDEFQKQIQKWEEVPKIQKAIINNKKMGRDPKNYRSGEQICTKMGRGAKKYRRPL